VWTMTRRKLHRVVEIAEILGVSKQRADQLRREPDVPGRSIVGLEGTCGRPQTFDGGRGHTQAARPGGVRGTPVVDSPPRRRALTSGQKDPQQKGIGNRDEHRLADVRHMDQRRCAVAVDQD
jgi:hypothetical protein